MAHLHLWSYHAIGRYGCWCYGGISTSVKRIGMVRVRGLQCWFVWKSHDYYFLCYESKHTDIETLHDFFLGCFGECFSSFELYLYFHGMVVLNGLVFVL